jgi:probable HAF family extracellular repeat protein
VGFLQDAVRAGGTVMRGKNTLFPAVVILLVLGSPLFAYQQVIDLGTLGGTSSRAQSINDSGQIVGEATNSSGYRRACLFDSTGGGANTDLGTLGGNESRAYCINDNGKVVGYAYDSSGNQNACRFDSISGGANKNLGEFTAYSINNGGSIVGNGRSTTKPYVPYAFMFTNSPYAHTVNLGGGYAYSINNSGKIVGTDGWGAYIFDSTGHGNNTLLCSGTGAAESINDLGQIVGQNNGRACLFDATGGGANINLGTISGYVDSEAFFISDIGQILGGVYNNVNGQIIGHACLFDATGQGNNIDLNTLIDPSSGWTLTFADCINDDGWIVGRGTNSDGDTHAFLLTPEPTSAILLIIGATLLRKKK